MMIKSKVYHRFDVRSQEETWEIGRLIAEYASPGALIGLTGPLGAGKTELTRGICRALRINEDISSPTFVLETVYDIPPPWRGESPAMLHHWDLYRIVGEDMECEIYDYANDPHKLTVVEWPERVPRVEDLLEVKILIDFVDSAQQELPVGAQSDKGAECYVDSGLRTITICVDHNSVLDNELRKQGALKYA